MFDNIQGNKLSRTLLSIMIVIVIAFSGIAPIYADEDVSNDTKSISSEQQDFESGFNEDYYVNGYATNSFDVDIKVNKDYSYDFAETIDVDFKTQKHGIVRNIPIAGNYKIKNISVEGDDYDVKKEYGNLIIKIGSADRYVNGRKTYKIKYRIENYLQRNSENNIYVDVLPTGWETVILSSKLRVKLPDDFKYDGFKAYSGHYGSSSDNNDKWYYNKENHSLESSDTMIPAKAGITLLVKTPKSYWVGARSKSWSNIFNTIVVLACFATVAFIRLSRNKNKEIVSPVMFNPPEGITPAELGYLADGAVDKKDVTSLYLYLASKGYIQIEEGSDKKAIKFKALKAPVNEPGFVNKFYKSLFGSDSESSIGKTASLEKAGESIGEAYDTICSQIEDKYSGEMSIFSGSSLVMEQLAMVIGCIGYGVTLALGIYRSDLPIYFSGAVVAMIGGLLIFTLLIWIYITSKIRTHYYYRKSMNAVKSASGLIVWIILYLIFTAGFILMMAAIGKKETPTYIFLIFALYSLLIPVFVVGIKARSEYNRKIYGEILGFKEFIATAEIDRINELVTDNPSYFYDVLPYAYVLGLTSKWVKKFDNIKIPEHEGYSYYNMTVFDYMRINMMMNSIQHSTYSGIAAANADSGGGGIGDFSGGGFSGGGSGGGGGGAW